MERNQSYYALSNALPADNPWADAIGNGCVGLAAIVYGIAGVCTKWVDINALFFVGVRSPIEWVLSFVVLLVVWRRGQSGFAELAFGRRDDRKGRWMIAARSLVLWLSNVLFALSFILLPVGDATAVMYTFGPAFSGIFAFLILGEPLLLGTWLLFIANAAGTLLVVRPELLFDATNHAADRPDPSMYWRGVGIAVAATVFSGLRPVFTRLAPGWHWASIAHSGCAWSLWLLSPISIAVFNAAHQSAFDVAGAELKCVFTAPVGGCVVDAPDGGSDSDPFPRSGAVAALFAAPLLAFAGNLLNVYAYQTVSHMHTANMLAYLEVPFAFALQHALFGETVDELDIAGILIILAAVALSALLSTRKVAQRVGSVPDLQGMDPELEDAERLSGVPASAKTEGDGFLAPLLPDPQEEPPNVENDRLNR